MPAKTVAAAALADAVTELGGLALAFAAVNRTSVYWPDGVTAESDTDHTVMLAWIAPSLAALLCPCLDVGLVTQFAVVHDAVEVFCGDTPTLRIDDIGRAAKAAREAAAVDEWERRFTGRLPWIPQMIQRYESQGDPEARFVKAVDKMMPRLVHAFDRCTGLHEIGMDAAELARGMPATTSRITSHGEFPELEALAVELGNRLAAVHAQTAPAAARNAASEDATVIALESAPAPPGSGVGR